jgi:N-acetylmuramic acid 6-phosphate etherase
MSNLQASNIKLHHRARAILSQETGLGEEDAAKIFEESGNDLRTAMVMARAGVSREQAERLLAAHRNSVRRAIDSLR